MTNQQRIGIAIGLACVVWLGATSPDTTPARAVPAWTGVTYWLDADSLFAEGCLGSGGPHGGCMCPLEMASDFRGRFTMTLNPRTPPGHTAFNITIINWVFVFDGVQYPITGTGYYDTWTDLYGNNWKSMTLDAVIYGEDVHFFSGVIADPAPTDGYPDNVEISLVSDTECFGYVINIDAARFRPPAAEVLTN